MRLTSAPAAALLLILLLAACRHEGAGPAAETAPVDPAASGAATASGDAATSGPAAPSDRAQAEAYYLLAQAAEAAGDLDAAVENYEQALARDPWSRPAGSDPIAGTPYAGLARICEGNGAPRAVARACGGVDTVLLFAPERLAVFNARRAAALLALGEVARARRVLTAAEKLDSGNPEVLLTRGRVAEAAGDPAEALRSYTRALFSRPGWPEAHLARGRLRAELRDDSGALEDLDSVLSDPDGIAAYPDAYRDRAALHCRLGEAKQAAVGWQVWADLTGKSAALNEMLEARGYLRNPPADMVAGPALVTWAREGCPG